ncbi:MAG: hypothetical protein GXY08_10175 [Ruminococcus sp.]|nr:hypothetical protein [Ruminococcus sp.]
MKKIIINHHPINYMMLAFFGIFLIAPLSMLIMMVCYEKGIDVGATVLIMLIPVVIYAVIFSLLNAAKAVVEWDDKNISVTYLKRKKISDPAI